MPISLPPLIVAPRDVLHTIAEAEDVLHAQGPTEEALIALAEANFSRDEFEAAMRWYAAAVRCTARSMRIVDVSHAQMRARYREMRKLVPERPVEWLGKPKRAADHVFCVMTCSGREELLGRTLRSLSGSGVDVWHDGHGGQAPSFFALLRYVADRMAASYITIIEDDVVLARDAVETIARIDMDDDLALVSWFTTDSPATMKFDPQISCVKARDYRFHQCVTLPMRTVHELLESEALRTWSEPHGADRIYAKAFPNRLCGLAYPNICEHEGGNESRVGNVGERKSATFIGGDRSALELVR